MACSSVNRFHPLQWPYSLEPLLSTFSACRDSMTSGRNPESVQCIAGVFCASRSLGDD